ncbi:MAG: hypothetical protein GXP55_22365 [Deltaproteobacteria bacterium]|nr:hypothetical protein [Deltaproteobacteria bacterium]
MTLRSFSTAALSATLLLALPSTLVGCSKDAATQIVLIVDTDLVIPSEADNIQLVATGPGGMNATTSQVLNGADGELPLVLTLTPAGGQLGPIELTIAATSGGSPVVARQVTTSFLAKQGKTLFVFLRKSCGAVACRGGQTCGNDGACMPTEVDPANLPDFTGSPPENLDAGGIACIATNDVETTCDGVDDDCNGMVDDGDLCPTMSGAPTLGASCMGGACVNTCAAGRGDCDGLYPNGCETDTDNTANHCGMCGNVCDSGACVAGACVGGGFQTSLGTTGSTETLAGMVLDPSGNLFVTGSFEASLDIGGMTFPNLGRYMYLAKYSPTGELLTAKAVGGTGTDTAVDLGVDGDGNITLLANFTGSATFGPDMVDAGPATSQNIVLVRYDNDLGYLGSRSLGSLAVDRAFAMDVMEDGTVTLAGFAGGPISFPSAVVDALFVMRFNVNATGGFDTVWAKAFTSASDASRWRSVTSDSSGNAILVGHHAGDFDLDGRPLSGTGSFVTKLATVDGGVRWVRDFGDSSGTIDQVAADGDDVLVLGSFTGSFNLAGALAPGSLTASSTTADGFVGKLKGAGGDATGGELIWQRSISSPQRIVPVGIAMEEPSRVVGVVGFEASAMLLGKSVPGIGDRDALAFHVSQNTAGTNIDSDALPGLRPIGSAGRETTQQMVHRGGRLCIGGLFDSTESIDLLATPGDAPYVPLGPASMIVSSGGRDIFLACFSTGAIPLGGI